MATLRTLLEGNGFHRVPLKKLVTGHYKLIAKINDVRGNFILDTGASNSCIGFDSIGFFSLDSEESDIKAAGAGAINMKTKLTRKNSLSINSKIFPPIDIVLFDLSHVNDALNQANEDPVHGIIGADFLKSSRAVIDYGRNCLYVK
jgi:hypothetical protein